MIHSWVWKRVSGAYRVFSPGSGSVGQVHCTLGRGGHSGDQNHASYASRDVRCTIGGPGISELQSSHDPDCGR